MSPCLGEYLYKGLFSIGVLGFSPYCREVRRASKGIGCLCDGCVCFFFYIVVCFSLGICHSFGGVHFFIVCL